MSKGKYKELKMKYHEKVGLVLFISGLFIMVHVPAGDITRRLIGLCMAVVGSGMFLSTSK